MSVVVQGRPTGSTRPASFDIEAHRGGRALRPENTLQSFANALSMGVDTLELDMAVTLIDSMVDEWKPEAYRDTYTERVEKLIADKKAGRTVTPESEPAEPTKVVDLLDALSRSVKSRQGKAKPAPDLSDLSKADLDRMARELGIKGRSKMSRAELENAIASALGKKKLAKRNAS